MRQDHVQPDRDDRRLSRRHLIKGAGLVAASGALGRSLEALAEDGADVRTQGPDGVSFEFVLNGKKTKAVAEPRRTLLDLLRLPPHGLTGAKESCDRGQCGTCTVWLDGQPILACTMLAVEVEGREVTTVEGLGSPESPHPVQQAFVEEDGLQCGFCTPGMVMACAWAVQEHGASLTAEQVRQATSGNLCRCGAHPHIVKAALRAAKGA